MKHGFSLLSPHVVQQSVEARFDLRLTGVLTPYNSYVNRVYGLTDEDGQAYVAKFYRPDRWTPEALAEEHSFLADCAEADLPVALPLLDPDGESLGEVDVCGEQGDQTYYFSLSKKKGGRNFDAEGDEDWLRLGRLLGRLHKVGLQRPFYHRNICHPAETTLLQMNEILDLELIHPDVEEDFADVCQTAMRLLPEYFSEIKSHRIHGDCHRGNILDRPGEGLLLMDFDDAMTGPAVQDLWLLLPGYREDCPRELNLLSEGYEDFCSLPGSCWDLVEPLRFMRMIHFLSWSARQRGDSGFYRSFPGWGSKAFWIKEVEDLRSQAQRL